MLMSFPDCLASIEGMWYKSLMQRLGIAKNGFVTAGHAALALLDYSSGNIYYADFGRYITPFGYGRVRSIFTDPDVHVEFKLKRGAKGNIENKDELLLYFDSSPEITHGKGRLLASFMEIKDASSSLKNLLVWSKRGSIPYGPFKNDNSNCSRFVHEFAMNSIDSSHRNYKRLKKSYKLTPSTISNVRFGSDDGYMYEVLEQKINRHECSKYKDDILRKVFSRPENFPLRANFRNALKTGPGANSFWLGGTGHGSWFRICDSREEGFELEIARVEEDGKEVFRHWFRGENCRLDLEGELQLVHDSNAMYCHIKQGSGILKFSKI